MRKEEISVMPGGPLPRPARLQLLSSNSSRAMAMASAAHAGGRCVWAPVQHPNTRTRPPQDAQDDDRLSVLYAASINLPPLGFLVIVVLSKMVAHWNAAVVRNPQKLDFPAVGLTSLAK